MPHAHTRAHTHTTQKDNEGGKTAVCISADTGFIQDIYFHKNIFPLYLNVHGHTFSSRWHCVCLESGAGIPGALQHLAKSCGRKLHQHLHTLFLSPVISVQFRVACLRTQSHWISISQQPLIWSCRNGLRMYMSIYVSLPLGLSVSVYKYHEDKGCKAICSPGQIYLLSGEIPCGSGLIVLTR